SDPLFFWYTGGPLCSSMAALLDEHGPFRIYADNKTVLINPYSWNRLANVVYTDSYIGGGFSYSTNPTKENFNQTDTQLIKDCYAAIKQFFLRFPQFRSNNFYLSGESYAGHIVPALSKMIVEKHETINSKFKGFILGNPLIDQASTGYIGDLSTLRGNALIDDSTWKMILKYCIDPYNANPYDPELNPTGFQPWKSKKCAEYSTKANKIAFPEDYDVKEDISGNERRVLTIERFYCTSVLGLNI
ncbi:unnamed protein product, partial [Didymodactylos carnosus]